MKLMGVLSCVCVSESSQQTLVWTYEDVPDSFPLTKEGFIVMSGASNRVRCV